VRIHSFQYPLYRRKAQAIGAKDVQRRRIGSERLPWGKVQRACGAKSGFTQCHPELGCGQEFGLSHSWQSAVQRREHCPISFMTPFEEGEAMNIPIPAETPDPNIDDPELPVPKPNEPPPDTMPPVIEQPMGDPPSKEPPAVLDDVFPKDGFPE
jgi:hypothetical protein